MEDYEQGALRKWLIIATFVTLCKAAIRESLAQ